MTETVPNSASATVPSSAQHSVAWLEPASNSLRLSGASTSSKHHSGAHFHHRHPQMNHHGENSAAPRYQHPIPGEDEEEVEDSVYTSSSSRANSSYRIHDSSFEESVDSPKLLNVTVSTHSKRWTQFEDSEEYGSGSDDESNEDTDDGHTVDDYDDGSDKPHMSSDTETRNLLEDAGDDEDDDEADVHSSEESDDLTESIDVPDSGTLTVPKKTSSHSQSSYSHHFATPFANETLYEMSRDQREYYERCFLHLMLSTQGKASRSGAVNGADERVVEFFKKSYLDSDQLSRIWMLSDVNEDGWLNLDEFSTAMHLIVLHVKGRNPIPPELPARVRPPVTPMRGTIVQKPLPNTNSTQASLWNSTASDPCAEASIATPRSAATTTAGKQNWKQFDFDKTDSSLKGYSLSDEQLHIQEQPPTTSALYKPPVAQFSDVPPILVDSRPTPLKTSQPLSCRTTAIAVSEGASQLTGIKFPLSPQNGPKGPPPKPPPRPTNRGHGRSASLDLNSMAFTTTNNTMSSSAAAGSNQLPSPPGVSGYPQIPAKERGSTLPASLQLSSMVSRPPPVVPPPRKILLPQTPVTVNVASQTDVEDDRMLELDLQLDERLERLNAPDSEKTNWKERCEMMRRLNSELEAERAKLAQIRLQLELRIQEFEQGRGPSKPTSL